VVAWDVQASVGWAHHAFFVRGWFEYRFGNAGDLAQLQTPVITIEMEDEPLRITSREGSIKAALADPRAPVLDTSHYLQAGAWYHAGKWIVEIYPYDPTSPRPLIGWWITVDAATLAVERVASS